MSIHNEPDERDYRYLRLMGCRAHGKNEDELAHREGLASKQDLYRQIREDGFPICPDCGTTHVDEKHCRGSDGAPRKKRGRKAKKFGERAQLPPAKSAIPLFRGTLERLIGNLDQLRGMDEYLQSRRFVGVGDKDGEKKAWGARQTPPELLTILITVEALAARHVGSSFVTRLIKTLHPSGVVEKTIPYRGGTLAEEKPAPQVNMRDLDTQIGKLRQHAENVARLIRGGKMGPGAPATEISPRDHSVIRLVKLRAKERVPDEQILEEVNEWFDRGRFGGGSCGIEKDFTIEKIRDLKELPFEDHTLKSNS